MARDASDATPIESRDQLVAAIEEGCKPAERWRIGTEHEKFGFRVDDLRPVPYDGPRGIRALLEGMERLSAGSRSSTAATSSGSPTRSAAAPSRWSPAASSSSPARR